MIHTMSLVDTRKLVVCRPLIDGLRTHHRRVAHGFSRGGHGSAYCSSLAVFALAISLMAYLLSGCAPRTVPFENPRIAREGIRAIWVTRWDYRSAADIAHVMENCRQAGFNTILFQVRGNGTVLYRSRLEPWAKELGGRDPGFDPLRVACKEAHRRGMSLHAWANVLPGWRGKKPPSNPKQLYNAHRDWFWRDAKGRYQPHGWYVSVNPCYPEVRRYLVAVMREIVEGYPVDGLHLDYIRFPNEWNSSYPVGARVPDYPRDPRTLALFRRATGQTPERAPQQWSNWRTDQVTALVFEIRNMMRRVKPRAVLSAAVGADQVKARREHFQDSKRWMAKGLVDAVFPMNYAGDEATFRKRLNLWARSGRQVKVVTGIMFDKRSPGTVNGQVDLALAAGKHFSAFAYNSLFERLGKSGKPMMDSLSKNRANLRRQVIPHIRRSLTSPPAGNRAW